MRSINFTDWNQGLNKVGLTKLLQNEGGVPLDEAKSAVDSILNGETVLIEFATNDLAMLILDNATKLGAVGTITD